MKILKIQKRSRRKSMFHLCLSKFIISQAHFSFSFWQSTQSHHNNYYIPLSNIHSQDFYWISQATPKISIKDMHSAPKQKSFPDSLTLKLDASWLNHLNAIRALWNGVRMEGSCLTVGQGKGSGALEGGQAQLLGIQAVGRSGGILPFRATRSLAQVSFLSGTVRPEFPCVIGKGGTQNFRFLGSGPLEFSGRKRHTFKWARWNLGQTVFYLSARRRIYLSTNLCLKVKQINFDILGNFSLFRTHFSPYILVVVIWNWWLLSPDCGLFSGKKWLRLRVWRCLNAPLLKVRRASLSGGRGAELVEKCEFLFHPAAQQHIHNCVTCSFIDIIIMCAHYLYFCSFPTFVLCASL
jgi:hypothetical protein